MTNALKEEGISLSKSPIKRQHQCKHRGLISRCKPLETLKNRKAKLAFARKHLKKPVWFWNKILRTDETKTNLYPNDGKIGVWRRKARR